MRFSTVLFDLDGTLTDPGEGISKCILAGLEEVGLPTPTQRQLELCIGPPLDQGFLALGARPDQVERLIEVYRSRYTKVGMLENLVYPEIPKLLIELASRGCRLFVATSKPTVFAEAIVEHFQLRDFFSGVFGSELNGNLSDKKQLLAHIRAKVGFDPGDTALVGDRRFDISAARAESLFSVGALWGYGTRAELETAGADVLAESPREVLSALAS